MVGVILDAADELFAERSPAAVSLREIADRAGVQHSLIHRHFGTKEELLKAVIDRASRDFRDSLVGSDVVDATCNAYRYMLEHPTLIRVVIQLVLDGDDPRDYISNSHGLNRFAGLVGETELGGHGDRRSQVASGNEAVAVGEDRAWPAEALPQAAVMLGAFSIGAVVAEQWLLAADGMEGVTTEQFRSAVERFISLTVGAIEPTSAA